jgi:hypothetical protein
LKIKKLITKQPTCTNTYEGNGIHPKNNKSNDTKTAKTKSVSDQPNNDNIDVIQTGIQVTVEETFFLPDKKILQVQRDYYQILHLFISNKVLRIA